jgi:Raf kinase inhibitor-like YbhB/YbcL family protein
VPNIGNIHKTYRSFAGISVSLNPIHPYMPYLKFLVPLVVFLIAIIEGCNNNTIKATHPSDLPSITPFRLSSPAFNNGDNIPAIYTCDSSDISPSLHWNNPFNNTSTYALIMDDPDAPVNTWVHWIVYNIPAADTALEMHAPVDSTLTNGIKQGLTSFRKIGYGGPCPPEGSHRYFFKLYALDTKLNVPAGLTKQQLLNAMKGHILAEADLMGRYTRNKNN